MPREGHVLLTEKPEKSDSENTRDGVYGRTVLRCYYGVVRMTIWYRMRSSGSAPKARTIGMIGKIDGNKLLHLE
jgi:hypothetical protein